MEKFLKICSELRNQDMLSYRRVDNWFRHLCYNTNKNIYYPIELIRVHKQQVPAGVLQFA